MADTKYTLEQHALLEKCSELHHKMQHYREFNLENGQWDPKHLLALLEVRREAVEAAKAAIEAGINRGTVLESLLMDLGIQAKYPTF